MMLGAAMKVTGAKPLAEIELKGDYCKNDWDRLARYMEVPWTLPAAFPIGTLAASRAFYWLDDQDDALAKRFALAAFNVYFGQGRDITPAETVAEFAEPLGVDRDALLAAVQDQAIKQRLKDETGKLRPRTPSENTTHPFRDPNLSRRHHGSPAPAVHGGLLRPGWARIELVGP